MRRVAVFDIDGTLTRTTGLDDRSFQRTARELLGLSSISLDWSSYPHSTDDAIAAHLTAIARGHAATRAEIDLFEQHFLRVLSEELAAGQGVAPVPGAGAMFAAVRAAGWIPALATGCWRRSALCKLGAAGLLAGEVGAAGCGAAFADDAWPRAKIIALAVGRACALEGCSELGQAPTAGEITCRGDAAECSSPRSPAAQSRASGAGGEFHAAPVHVVYVGDGTWDVRACRTGGYRFVGIAEGQRAAALRQEGASTVLADYTDQRAFLEALENAQPPRGA